MNLRDFCRLPDFPLAVLTTFNVDPLFFERVVLNDLRAGGATRIFVLADANQAVAQITGARGQLVSLGRSYRLIPVQMKGSFHPKVCVRIGRKDALVASGSHNLTRSGWLGCSTQGQSGGNRESTVTWRVTPGTTQAKELYKNLHQLFSVFEYAGDRDELSAQLAATWLETEQKEMSSASDPAWGVFGARSSLASTLEERWRGRRFERLRMVSGSTDEQGAMIRWAARTFGVTEAVVEIDQAFCSFDPGALSDLSVDLRIKTYDGRPRTHLKAALFESDAGSAAVVGSANCSGSAWLRTSAEGGNVESVVIYDHCRPADFAHLFRPDQGEASRWQDMKLQPSQAAVGMPHQKLGLLKLQFQSSVDLFTVFLEDSPGDCAILTLIVQSYRLPLEPTQDPKLWRASALNFKSGPETLFGQVEIDKGGFVEVTNVTWVDDVDRLDEVSGHHLPFGAVRRLSSKTISEDYKCLLEDLQVLSKALLTQPSEFPDPPITIHQQKKVPAATESARPVTAADVILSMDRLKSHGAAHSLTSIPLGTVSLAGIMRILFGEDLCTSDIDPTEAEHGNPSMDDPPERKPGSTSPPPAKPSSKTEAGPTAAQRQKLLKQLNEFKDQLSALSFAQNCTARQLQQAAAFPLGVALLAARGPWIQAEDHSALAKIIREVCEVLFCCGKRETDKKSGRQWTRPPLAMEIRERYASKGQVEEFDQIIGDGTLLIVVLSSLTILNESSEMRFARNLVFCDVAQFGPLSSNLTPEYLAPLVKRLSLSSSVDFQEKIKQLGMAMEALDQHVADHFDEWRSNVPTSAQVGDWLWRPKLGYVQVTKLVEPDKAVIHVRNRAEDMMVMLSFYVNLQNESRCDSALSAFLEASNK